MYDDLPVATRAGAHRRAADLLAAEGAPAQQVAPHLLDAEPAGDAGSVAILRSAAKEARAMARWKRRSRTWSARYESRRARGARGAAVRAWCGGAHRPRTGIEHLHTALELATDPLSGSRRHVSSRAT